VHVLVYGCCVGASGKFETGLLPSLERFEPGAHVIVRREQRSIFEAYNSIMEEAATLDGLEGLVLVHDDVVFRDGTTRPALFDALRDPATGVVGVVGGAGQHELSWWTCARLLGHVEHATHKDDFSRGLVTADVVDGLFMAVSPTVVRRVRLEGRGYPPFHGYDGEMCSLVRRDGLAVMVTDLELYHDCKPGQWGRPEYRQAQLEWRRRWQRPSLAGNAVLLAKRDLLAAATSRPRLARFLRVAG
jgi:Glycosyltransferase like family